MATMEVFYKQVLIFMFSLLEKGELEEKNIIQISKLFEKNLKN